MDNEFGEAEFYARHFRLPEFTVFTQELLRNSKVLIIGLGGLGCPAATYLAGAGVGALGLMDGDYVSISNLHRQTLYSLKSVGKKKVLVAAEVLSASNPFVSFQLFDELANIHNLSNIVRHYDLVLDCTDNFPTKYLINDVCEQLGTPLVYGSIFQYEGHVSVFHYSSKGTEGFSYRDLYPNPPPAGLVQNCGEAGVIGVLPGIIGSFQANEAIKLITKKGEPLSGRLLTYDMLKAEASTFHLSKHLSATSHIRKENRELNCYEEISLEDLELKIATGASTILVDVRNESEHKANNIGGINIPLEDLPNRLEEILFNQEVVLYCQSGVRSARAALYLDSVSATTNIFSLSGGLLAYKSHSLSACLISS